LRCRHRHAFSRSSHPEVTTHLPDLDRSTDVAHPNARIASRLPRSALRSPRIRRPRDAESRAGRGPAAHHARCGGRRCPEGRRRLWRAVRNRHGSASTSQRGRRRRPLPCVGGRRGRSVERVDRKWQVRGLVPRARTLRRHVLAARPARDQHAPAGDGTSAQVRFRTATAARSAAPVRFAWGGDLGGQNVCRDRASGYAIFDRIAATEPSFFIGLGDMIYATTRACRRAPRERAASATGAARRSRLLPRGLEYERADPAFLRMLAQVPYERLGRPRGARRLRTARRRRGGIVRRRHAPDADRAAGLRRLGAARDHAGCAAVPESPLGPSRRAVHPRHPELPRSEPRRGSSRGAATAARRSSDGVAEEGRRRVRCDLEDLRRQRAALPRHRPARGA